MLTCANCKREFPVDTGILLNLAGDFVCSERCKLEYETERDNFFHHIVESEEACEKYLLGEDDDE